MSRRINLKNILHKILNFFKTIPHLKKYLLFAIVMTVFFVIINFPYDNIITQNLLKIKSRSFKISRISGMNFSLLRDSTIDMIKIDLNKGAECTLKNIILNPSLNPFSIMDKKYRADIEIKNITYKNDELSILSSANLNSDMIVGSTGIPESGFLNIMTGGTTIYMEKVSIPTPMGEFPLDLKQLVLKSILFKVNFQKGKAIIEKGNISGKDLKVNIQGDMILKNIYGNSKLNLRVDIDEKSLALEKYKDLIASVIKNNKISLKIAGTIARPRITLIK